MSDPTRRHVNDPRVGSVWISDRYAQMRCDGGMGGCGNSVARAPRIIVPPKPFLMGVSPEPRRVWTTLHFCQPHVEQQEREQLLQRLLTDQMKANVEKVAKIKWTHEYKPDFDHAYIEWVLVTTPEYRQFLSFIQLQNLQDIQGVPLL